MTTCIEQKICACGACAYENCTGAIKETGPKLFSSAAHMILICNSTGNCVLLLFQSTSITFCFHILNESFFNLLLFCRSRTLIEKNQHLVNFTINVAKYFKIKCDG